VDTEGVLTPHRVRVGISDGQRTQVTARDLQQGTSIVISATQPGAATATTATANPLQPAQTGGGPRGPF
jgi:hypothetical protein